MMMILGIGYIIMLMYLLVILIALIGGCMLLLCYRDSLAEVNQLFDSPIIEKIPYIEALKGLKKKSFSKVRKEHRTMDQCAICLGDYTEKDKVAELNCDQRHYFHAACLEDWLKRKPECPLCKKPVVNE